MTGGSMTNTRLARVSVVLLSAAGIALLPWIMVLAATVRDAAGWVALDVLEACCLLATAHRLRRAGGRHRPSAALAALLLTADAWCDLRTAAPGADLAVAVAMALLAELPLAALCATLALRPAPGAARVAPAVVAPAGAGARVVMPRRPTASTVRRAAASIAVRPRTRPAARSHPARPAAARRSAKSAESAPRRSGRMRLSSPARA